MTINDIKKLAKQSFTKNNLDLKVIKKITTKLNKKQLKVYIKYLKKIENEKIIQVFTPIYKIDDKVINKIKNMFPNKEIECIEDSSLIAGIRIVDNDMVYDFNLKDSLDNLIAHLKRSYD